MTTLTQTPPKGQVFAGVDTHADTHHAAVVDRVGRALGDREFPATPAGYRALLAWVRSWGVLGSVGVEGTGAYGAELARVLTAAGEAVKEVDRPDRSSRRAHGKTDPLDAYAAAQAVASGRAAGTPKTRDGIVESIRCLRVARRSAATKMALRCLAGRHLTLTQELTELDAALAELTAVAAPGLLTKTGVGVDVAGQLLVTAGDNPDRLRSEASFAHLTGTAPIPASSGRTTRHRLNRGGDRGANNALHTVALVRMRYDERTRAYVLRRTAEGLSKKDIMRCLKRAIAREIYHEITHPQQSEGAA